MGVTGLQGIGEILRKTREAKDITLDQVAEATKIRVRYLQAIEEENFGVLPGEVYARGFVTAYLKYLGIKDDPQVATILQARPKQPEPEVAPAHVEDEKEKERQSRSSRRAAHNTMSSRKKMPAAAFEEKPLSKKSSLIIVLSIVAILALLAIQWVYTKSQEEPATPLDSQQSEVQGQQETDGQTTPEGEGQQTTQPDPVAPPVQTYNGLEMHLEILDANAGQTDQCWMRITVDGKTSEATMSEGQTQDLQANDSIQLSLGNAGVVKITLNGQDLGVLGGQGEVVKKEFKAADYATSGQ